MRLNVPFRCLVLAGLIAASAPHAFGMRCNDRLVSIGDSKAEVLGKCGNPSFSSFVALETVKQADRNGSVAVEVPVEQWTYSQGPNTLLKLLTFKGGRLVGIEDGERVPENPGKQIFSAAVGDSQGGCPAKMGGAAVQGGRRNGDGKISFRGSDDGRA